MDEEVSPFSGDAESGPGHLEGRFAYAVKGAAYVPGSVAGDYHHATPAEPALLPAWKGDPRSACGSGRVRVESSAAGIRVGRGLEKSRTDQRFSPQRVRGTTPISRGHPNRGVPRARFSRSGRVVPAAASAKEGPAPKRSDRRAAIPTQKAAKGIHPARPSATPALFPTQAPEKRAISRRSRPRGSCLLAARAGLPCPWRRAGRPR